MLTDAGGWERELVHRGGFGTPSKHEGFVATTGIYIQVEAQGDVEKRPEIWLESLFAEVLPESGEE